jgi:ABC-type uncharacterized transport system substrate-binding protein
MMPGSLLAQGETPRRIGMLERTSQSANALNLEAFRQGMLALGNAEPKGYAIKYRSADGHDERFPALAAELVRSKVDIIVTRGTPATLAAKNATRTIPIVVARASAIRSDRASSPAWRGQAGTSQA